MADEHHEVEAFVASVAADGGILGNYIVIAEVMHERGVSLSFSVSDGIPPWTAIGMLQSVASMLDMAAYDYTEDPGEPEEI